MLPENAPHRIPTAFRTAPFANPQDFVDENGNAIPLDRLTRDQAAAIQDLTVIESLDPKTGKVTGLRYRYKLQDKQKALENLGRHLGLWGPDFSLNTTVVVNQQADKADAAMLEDLMLRIVNDRKRATELPPPLRIVSSNKDTMSPDPAPPSESAPPPVEDKPQSTTEAYFEWSKRPIGPP
jgi:hypothetical protein